ncbi:MAG: RHS repeat-associated core domain-containing protein [Sphingobacteriaceae bacterium]|nr:RHS repeat-associated core domain-containing protein [Sphingobacteriaceae bacterium]
MVDYLSWIRQVLGESVYQQLLQLSPNVLNFEKVFTLQEQYLYGSKRLGVRRPKLLLATAPHLLKAYALELVHESLLQIEDANRFRWLESKTVLKGPECVVFSQTLTASGCAKSEIQIGNRQSEINLVLDRKTGVKASATATTYAWFKADVASAQDYYPFGSLLPGRTYTAAAGEGYRFGFNGMQRDDEVKGPGNSLDFGARMYDSRLGRWMSMDALARKYPSVSPYVFALNVPIFAKDPDGNVVIFINGQHAGSGGTAAYWGGYDHKVMKAIGDHSARYVDGALGGWTNTGRNAASGAFAGSKMGWIGSVAGAALVVGNNSNINMKVRMTAGEVQGMKDAADIIANLNEGETIKIVTHSMGTAFARGYTQGILNYAKQHGLQDKVKFEYELDVNSFQGGDLPKDKNVKLTQNKTGGLDGGNSVSEALQGNSVPTVAKIPGAEDLSLTNPLDQNRGHEIGQMDIKGVPFLGNNGGRSSRPIEQGNNNESRP